MYNILERRNRMKTDDFDYYLPEELIAQVPLEHREESKLLVLDKDTGEIIDDKSYDIINYLNYNINNSYFLKFTFIASSSKFKN